MTFIEGMNIILNFKHCCLGGEHNCLVPSSNLTFFARYSYFFVPVAILASFFLFDTLHLEAPSL